MSDALIGKWIIEMPELGHMGKSDVETLKQFFSRKEDRYRPAYARNTIDRPRQCVFGATTNESEYLRDGTGNRRYWPVRCGQTDLEWLKANRDQIFAEALAAYEAGEQWHLTEEEEVLARVEQQDRMVVDVMEGDILSRTRRLQRDHGFAPFGELCKQVFGASRTVTQQESNRVRAVLQANGAFKGKRIKDRGPFRDQIPWTLPKT